MSGSIAVHSQELCRRAVPTNDGSQLSSTVESLWATLLLPAFYREPVSDHLILVSPGPESHQIKKTAAECFCYLPMHSGYQHLTL